MKMKLQKLFLDFFPSAAILTFFYDHAKKIPQSCEINSCFMKQNSDIFKFISSYKIIKIPRDHSYMPFIQCGRSFWGGGIYEYLCKLNLLKYVLLLPPCNLVYTKKNWKQWNGIKIYKWHSMASAFLFQTFSSC